MLFIIYVLIDFSNKYTKIHSLRTGKLFNIYGHVHLHFLLVFSPYERNSHKSLKYLPAATEWLPFFILLFQMPRKGVYYQQNNI